MYGNCKWLQPSRNASNNYSTQLTNYIADCAAII